MYSRGNNKVAKSKKDTPTDKGSADDTLPEADTLTSGADDAAEDSLAADAGEDRLAGTDLPEDSGDDSPAAEGDTLSADGLETGDPADTDPDAEPAPSEETVPHEGGDVAAGASDDTLADTAAPFEDTLEAAAPVADPQVVRETVVERKGGFFPMLLGGVVAAGLGYAAGAYPDLPFIGSQSAEEDPFVTQTLAALRDQDERIEALSKRADATDDAVAGVDLGPLGTSVTALETDLGALKTELTETQDQLTGLGTLITDLDRRLTTLEKQPLKDAVSPETVAAYERELEALKAQVTAQQADLLAAQKEQQAAMDAARKEVEAMAARARASEESAEVRARLAASRAALADLTTRARDGQPYAEPLAVLTGNGVDVPGPLVEGAEEGLPTASALISSFPDAARDALAAARASGADGDEAGSVAGFFRSQLGARSVTPREGDDPDAVLSRAEAALRGGDLDTTLREIDSLPETARAEMSDWVAQATLRRDALAAAADLSQQLNQE